jgi:hypothetical protein
LKLFSDLWRRSRPKKGPFATALLSNALGALVYGSRLCFVNARGGGRGRLTSQPGRSCARDDRSRDPGAAG